ASNPESSLTAGTTFWYDITRPTTSVNSLSSTGYASSVSSISGRAFDLTAGLATNGVEIAIWDKTLGKWWSSGNFNSNTKVWNQQDSGSSTAWNFKDGLAAGVFDAKFLTGDVMVIQSRAHDAALDVVNQGPPPNGLDNNLTAVDSMTVTIDK